MLPRGLPHCITRVATRSRSPCMHAHAARQHRAFGSTTGKSQCLRLHRRRIGLYASLALSGGFLLAAPSSGSATTASVEAIKLNAPPDDNETTSDLMARLDSATLSQSSHHLHSLSISQLLRSYVVFLVCSSSLLVDIAPAANDFLESARDTLPLGLGHLLWQPFLFVMRHTFFAQFVAGESAAETEPLIAELYDRSCGAMLNWSAEAQYGGGATHAASGQKTSRILPEAVGELTRAIQAIARFRPQDAEKTTMMAIKITGLVSDESIFERGTDALLSSTTYARGESPPSHELIPSSPYLSEADDRDLHELYGCLRAMCRLAHSSGIRIAFDAEQSWIQPCLDRLVDLLSAEFNASGSLVVYKTYQANTRQALDAVRRDLVRARDSGYVLGVKLVRGAYVTSENARAMRTGSTSKVWSTKAESDSCFDACASLLLDEIIESVKQDRPGSSVIFATHNAKSVQKNIQQLNGAGLISEMDSAYSVDARLRGRVVFAQLMGMADTLSSTMVKLFPSESSGSSFPINSLYIPYGRIERVLPYLVRRAQENKSILQGSDDSGRDGAAEQRRAVGAEIRRRLFPALFA